MENRTIEERIFHIIRKRALLIIILTLILGAVLVFTTKEEKTTLYTTKTTVFISRPPTAGTPLVLDDVTMSQQLVNPYSELVKSTKVANKIIENLNLEMGPYEMVGMIATGPRPGSQMLDIIVTTKDKDLAPVVALEAAKVLDEVGQELRGEDFVELVNEPREAQVKESENKNIAVITTFFAAFILSALGVIAYDLVARKVSRKQRHDA